MKYLITILCLKLSFLPLFAQDSIEFKGLINKNSVSRTIRRIGQSLEHQRTLPEKIIILKLDSTGGDIEQARRFVREIKRLNLEPDISIHTMVSSRRKNCESACTIVFTAGKERLAHINSRFGFHSPRYQRGAPRGTNIQEIEEKYRSIWLSYIEPIDEHFAALIKGERWLYRDRMSYVNAQDAYPGYVTEIIR